MTKIGNELVWAEERYAVTQAAKTAAKKGAKMERDRIKQGWRWVNVGRRSKILVPCDKKGNPTQEGLRRIERMKQNLGIK